CTCRRKQVRYLVAMLLMMTPLGTTSTTLPEDTARLDAELAERLANIGAPCTTETDIIEGTCVLEVRKPKY
ncbi:MAG: hypothetical protein OEV31_06315, partial [Gammaproteobacteria bacterium]|nr:hypothetical protein [Gammaproteobacteria bacterium]